MRRCRSRVEKSCNWSRCLVYCMTIWTLIINNKNVGNGHGLVVNALKGERKQSYSSSSLLRRQLQVVVAPQVESKKCKKRPKKKEDPKKKEKDEKKDKKGKDKKDKKEKKDPKEKKGKDKKESKKDPKADDNLPFCARRRTVKECNDIRRGKLPKNIRADGQLSLEINTGQTDQVSRVISNLQDTLQTNTATIAVGCKPPARPFRQQKQQPPKQQQPPPQQPLNRRQRYLQEEQVEEEQEENESIHENLLAVEFGSLDDSQDQCTSERRVRRGQCMVLKSNVDIFYDGERSPRVEEEIFDDLEAFIQSQISFLDLGDDVTVQAVQLQTVTGAGASETPSNTNLQPQARSVSRNVVYAAGAAGALLVAVAGYAFFKRRRGNDDDDDDDDDDDEGKYASGGAIRAVPIFDEDVNDDKGKKDIAEATAYIVQDDIDNKSITSNKSGVGGFFGWGGKKSPPPPPRPTIVRAPSIQVQNQGTNSHGEYGEEIEMIHDARY